MSNENKKTKRNFSLIFRFIQLIFALVFVFFLSFFITISIKTPHPIDYIKTAYFDDTSKDKIIEDYANDKREHKSSAASTTTRIGDKEKTSEKSLDTSNDRNIEVADNETSKLKEKIERLKSIKKDFNGKLLEKEHYLTLDEIPRSLRQAIIAVEDSRFYTHKGFDLSSIARAAVVNFEAGKIEEGGSTITQQLVKNLFLSQEQSFSRKIEEVMLSMEMEKQFTKNEILELYLNTIYFGSSFYGVYDAAEGYFGVEPKDLTLAESAMLAGLPNAPSLYSPYVDFMLAKKRQLIVIDAMVKANILTAREAEKAKIDTITLVRE